MEFINRITKWIRDEWRWRQLMSKRGDQHAAAERDAKAARHQIKNDRNSGKPPSDHDIQKRGEALTKAADLKAAQQGKR